MGNILKIKNPIMIYTFIRTQYNKIISTMFFANTKSSSDTDASNSLQLIVQWNQTDNAEQSGEECGLWSRAPESESRLQYC